MTQLRRGIAACCRHRVFTTIFAVVYNVATGRTASSCKRLKTIMTNNKTLLVFRCLFAMSVLMVSLFYFLVHTDKGFIGIMKPMKDEMMFLLNQPGCRIARVDPLHPIVWQYLHVLAPLQCTGRNGKAPLVVRGDEVGHPSVRITEAAINRYGDNLVCYYQEILRRGDKSFYLANATHAMLSVVTNVSEEFIRVECLDKRSAVLDYDYFPFIQRKAEVEKRKKRAMKARRKVTEKLNVLLVGIDAMTRNHFLRYMKKTYTYLNQHFAHVEMVGYNKVGDNTYPNLVAMLTGHLETEFNNTSRVYADTLPLIWKDYRRNGYKTLYAQDQVAIGPFNWARKGFQEPPTDYYYRPFGLSVEKSQLLKRKMGCFKNRLESDVLLDYTLDLFDKFPDDLLFSLTFLCRLTHDHFNYLSFHDEPFLRFFRSLHTRGHLNRTIVFFFGDHGYRIGNFRKTSVGRHEQKLPFMTFILPPWFKTKYPDMYSTLRANSNRLTTPLDVNAMLREILTFDGHPKTNLDPHGSSVNLFASVVAANRTCQSAHIALQYCACPQWENVSAKASVVVKGAYKMVEFMNGLTRHERARCSELYLHRVLQSAKGHLVHGSEEDKSSSSYYRITLKVMPSGATYEGIVLHSLNSETQYTVFPEIDRLNFYGSETRCVYEARLKAYCYCFK